VDAGLDELSRSRLATSLAPPRRPTGHAQEPCLRAQARLDLELRPISAIPFCVGEASDPSLIQKIGAPPTRAVTGRSELFRLACQFAATEDASCAAHGKTGASFVARSALSLDVIPVLVTGTHFSAFSGSRDGSRTLQQVVEHVGGQVIRGNR
jgi:hypothetical protein